MLRSYFVCLFTTAMLLGSVTVPGLSTSLQGQSLPVRSASQVDLGSLPPDRFPDEGWEVISWDDPGEWVVVDVTTRGIQPGIANASRRLLDLMDEATVPTVYYFPPGDYTFTDPIDIKSDNVIIRGAGSHLTRFFIDGPGNHEFRFLGWDDDPINVRSSVPEGGQQLALANTSGLRVGDLIEVSQEVPEWRAEWGKRSWGQVVFITEIDGNQITVDMPLTLGLSTSKRPQITRLRPIVNVGIEDLYIERKQYGESSNIEMRTVYNAFVRNVESYNAVKFHVFLNRCRQVVIEGNYIHDAQNFGTGGHGYGVNLENLSTQILVTNNIFKNLRHHILVQTGTNHSVISYNYNVDLVELVDLSLHGHYSNNNLYEGNIVWWAGFADFWGQLGPNNTLFRNRVWGKRENDEGVVIYDNSDKQNLIANDFLRDSFIEKDADVDDTFEEGNIVRGRTRWNDLDASSNIPASLYLDRAPDFWDPSLAWPPFGPGVNGSSSNQIPAQQRYEDILGGVRDEKPPGEGQDTVYITDVHASNYQGQARPEYTLDEDLLTHWEARGEGQWIQFDLSGIEELEQIGILWRRGNERVSYFDVAVSTDGDEWVPLLENAESSGKGRSVEYYSFEPTPMRHLRIIGNGNSEDTWNSITEVILGIEQRVLTDSRDSILYGDVSGDGSISAYDASIALLYSTGMVSLEKPATDAADVTGNGDVSALDASLILQYVARVITCFPANVGC